jgi:hypothetical protein
MQFVRKKKRGVTKKVCRLWLSAENYRVVWRREIFGVRVPARFQACVRVMIPNYSGKEESRETVQMWDFLFKPKLYKTLKAAEDDCERHYRLWSKACEATGVRSLIEIFGKLPDAIPTWVRKRMNHKALAILLARRARKYADEEDECEPSPDDPTRVSDSSVGPMEPTSETPIPASPAEAGDGNTTKRTRRARSKATSIDELSPAPPAEAPAVAHDTPAKKRTAKSSKPSRQRSKSTTASPKRAKKRSKGSRTKKSTPSGS